MAVNYKSAQLDQHRGTLSKAMLSSAYTISVLQARSHCNRIKEMIKLSPKPHGL